MKNRKNLRIDTSFITAVEEKAKSTCKTVRNNPHTSIFHFLLCLSVVSMLSVMVIHPSVNDADLKTDFHSQYVHYQNLKESIFIAQMPKTLTVSRNNLRNLQNSMNIHSAEKVANPLDNCSPTEQIKLYHNRTSNAWYIQSIDGNSRDKMIGGDEFYVTYTEETNKTASPEKEELEPTAVAFVHDLNNGKYTLDFVMTPMAQKTKSSITSSSTGRITVHFEYTCGIGRLSQPAKQNWKSAGMMYQESFYSDFNIQRPPIREFKLPSPSVDFSKYSSVKFFGDSTMYQLVVKDRVEKPDKSGYENLYFQRNVEFRSNVRSELTTKKLKPSFLRKLVLYHGKQLRLGEKVALVVGSSIWDLLIVENIQGNDFDDHLKACKEFVLTIRERYPNVDLYWKGTSSLHPHRVDCKEANYDYEDCFRSTKYLSNSRVVNLEEKQRKLMEELKVPYLDLYPAYYLSAYYMAPGDGRHSVPALNEHILSWFYPKIKTN